MRRTIPLLAALSLSSMLGYAIPTQADEVSAASQTNTAVIRVSGMT